jgi:hypothetical protein
MFKSIGSPEVSLSDSTEKIIPLMMKNHSFMDRELLREPCHGEKGSMAAHNFAIPEGFGLICP